MGKKERERVKSVSTIHDKERGRPREDTDEIARERGLVLLSERGGMSDLIDRLTRSF